MEEPDTNAPAAIITWLSYPGISHGSGVTKLSTGEPFCTPWQKAVRFSAFFISTAVIISPRLSSLFGKHSNPSKVIISDVKAAVFTALATISGAKKSPWYISLFWLSVQPTSLPIPTQVRRYAHCSTSFLFPAI